jgi:hypothetical protein
MVLISGLELLLEWERLSLYGRYGCVEMTRFLMTRIVLSCRLSIDIPIFSVYGHLCSRWRIAISLRRSVHDWRLRQGTLFPYMGGSIIYRLVLHLLLRRSTIAHDWYVFRLFMDFVLRWDLNGCVHYGYAEAGVIAWLRNKTPIIKRDFYSRAPGSLFVLSFPQPLNFSSVFPSLQFETPRRRSDGRVAIWSEALDRYRWWLGRRGGCEWTVVFEWCWLLTQWDTSDWRSLTQSFPLHPRLEELTAPPPPRRPALLPYGVIRPRAAPAPTTTPGRWRGLRLH